MVNKLFEQFVIRKTNIKNRVCVPPMVCFNWSGLDGLMSQRHIEHYTKMAQGGPGLIIVEATCVDSSIGRIAFSQLGLWADQQIDGHTQLVNAVHKENAKVFVQIHHAGAVSVGETHIAPSDYLVKNADGTSYTAYEMSVEDIRGVEEQFVSAAVRAAKAGYDGVELHACHSYLLSQFLNSRVNKRGDAYGTEPTTIIQNILTKLRPLVPTDFVIGVRLGAYEPTFADGVRHAKQIEQLGADYLSISYGFSREHEPVAPPQDFLHKDIVFAAGEIKKQVGIPVFAVNGIQDGAAAEDILAQTGVDAVCIGRGFLVNYDWARDVKAGREPGRCLYCPTCSWRESPDKCAGKILLQRNRAKQA